MINFNPIASSADLKAYFKVSAGKAADAGKGAEVKGERVEISETSNELKSTKAAVDALPEVRLDKVEEIRRKIAANDYPIENNLDKALKAMIEKHLLS